MTMYHYAGLLLATLAIASGSVIPEKLVENPPELTEEIDQASRTKRETVEAPEGNPLITLVDQMFNRADRNNDGGLNETEFWGTFRAFDGDGDQRITLREYIGLFHSGMIPGVNRIPNLAHTAAMLFYAGDMNGDQYLSREDAVIIFNNLDKDGNSRISKEEYFARWQEVMHRLQFRSQAQGRRREK